MTLLQSNFKQKNDWTCGPAVARIILHYYGQARPLDEIIKELRTTKRGTANMNLLRLLKKYKVSYKVREHASLLTLKRYLRNHWIVVAYHIPIHNESHYSIITRMDRNRVYFHDTWFGASHSYTHEYFLKNWWDEEAVRWMLAVEK